MFNCQSHIYVSSIVQLNYRIFSKSRLEAERLRNMFYDYKTIVMGASFRNIGEITELAGCDYLTIAPNLLEQLYNSQDKVPQKLKAEDVKNLDIEKKSYLKDEANFRFDFNEEQMAVEKLREGISKFAADAVTLKDIIKKKIQA